MTPLRCITVTAYAKIITLTLVGLIIAMSSRAIAEEGCESSKIKINVRTIHASGPRDITSANKTGSPVVSMENSLKDLKPKLELLPFSSFNLISQKEEEISVKRKESIQLPNGQALFFRPIYMDKQRVGMWLSWKDTDGTDILNTRVHFDADESIVTGTDYRDNEGRILVIKAQRVQSQK